MARWRAVDQRPHWSSEPDNVLLTSLADLPDRGIKASSRTLPTQTVKESGLRTRPGPTAPSCRLQS